MAALFQHFADIEAVAYISRRKYQTGGKLHRTVRVSVGCEKSNRSNVRPRSIRVLFKILASQWFALPFGRHR